MADAKEKKESPARYTQYEVSGDSVKCKKRSCPRCGPGIFMAEHKGRVHCGKCGYAESNKSEKSE